MTQYFCTSIFIFTLLIIGMVLGRNAIDVQDKSRRDPGSLPLKVATPELVANYPLSITSLRKPSGVPKPSDRRGFCHFEHTCGTRVAPGPTTADVHGFRCYCFGKGEDEKNLCFAGRCYDERWSIPRSDKDLDVMGLCEVVYDTSHRTDESLCARKNIQGEHYFLDPPDYMPRL